MLVKYLILNNIQRYQLKLKVAGFLLNNQHAN